MKELQIIAYFFVVVTKYLDKCNLRKDELILAYVSRVQSTWEGKHGGRSVRQLVTSHSKSGSRECGVVALSSLFPLINSGTRAEGMVLPTLRVGFSISVNLI